ncbi:MAG: hypothetical protein PQJ59_18055 [Spirochaetales bacterium]|nr:hypothetical protein [Spirochaetales bacterium]
MKFKTIFILFNIIVLFAFLFITLIPLVMLGNEYSSLFWSQNWILVALFVLFISLLDGYFVINWKLFHYLEEEDWPGLLYYLEEKIFDQKKLKKRYVSLYINGALSVSNLDKIDRLEAEVRDKKPDLFRITGLQFGVNRLLKKDAAGAELFFHEILAMDKVHDREWILWCLAFSCYSGKRVDEAMEPLMEILESKTKDKVLRLLDCYLLDTLRDKIPMEKQTLLSEKTLELKKETISLSAWNRALEKSRESNILSVFMSSLIEDARKWIGQIEG